MTPPIIISIQDRDHFFVQGLKHILQMYFGAEGRSVSFVSITDRKTPDLIIQSERTSRPIPTGCMWRFLHRDFPRVLTVKDKPRKESKSLPCCQNALNVITRHEHPTVFAQRVAYLFAMQPSANPPCTRCTLALSPREREVLQAISAELAPQQVATKLAIHVKTVSTHKHMAMRKLGLLHNHELYHWLRCGGLEFESDRRRGTTGMIC